MSASSIVGPVISLPQAPHLIVCSDVIIIHLNKYNYQIEKKPKKHGLISNKPIWMSTYESKEGKMLREHM